MEFTNLTRGNEIGANCYHLNFGADGNIVLDSGMSPKVEGTEGLPLLDHLHPESVESIFITHAHHDHIGSLPVLMRHQADARVFMSEGTYFLGDPLLHNSVEVMFKQKTELNLPELPLFTHKEIDRGSEKWQACGLEREWSIDGYPDPENEPLSFKFYDAGHILGSVGVMLNHRGRKIFYTGDVNFKDQTLSLAADFPKEPVDVLITETTRGSHATAPDYTRDNEVQKLADAILNTFDRGGAVMIPVFAMGKTQELLAMIHHLQKQHRIPKCPIYIGGLGRSLTVVYDKLAARSRRKHPKLRLLEDVAPEVLDGRRIQDFKPKRGEIYLISSGMMTEKTLSNILAQRFLSMERHSILFVGYCDPESPAGMLLATPRGKHVVLDSRVGEQPVLCEVKRFDMTAHAQREDILDYILAVDPKICLLVHGDTDSLGWFQNQLNDLRPNIKVVIPPPGKTLSI